ncbi:conserved exported hypothetical protein [Agrobacterium tomkonis CFBP 6623]|uniref:Uncharacterized protein n=1 Tax=Agrobacterium tomkonis CFBP 6623 TaxID=1183432 RepID=A0A1S7NUR6_9HYPH|nr:conserved exported hypothetical protein [Agrobacterium tomkonis CFBP 6623]
MCSTPLSFSALRTISAPVMRLLFSVLSLSVIACFHPALALDIEEPEGLFEDIKKGPLRSLVQRMGAFAGWLHHPAHAPSHHDKYVKIFHGPEC